MSTDDGNQLLRSKDINKTRVSKVTMPHCQDSGNGTACPGKWLCHHPCI